MSSLMFSNSVHLGWSVLSVQGQIDSKTVPQFQEALDQYLSTDSSFAIDLTNVPFMSSAGLRALLVIHNKASSRGNELAFVGINDDIQDVMRVTGFLEHFTLVSTLDDLAVVT